MVLLNKLFYLKFIAISCTLGVFCACEKEAKETASTSESGIPREETLYIGGFDWAPPSTFNPLDHDPNFPVDGNVRLLYETLIAYNQLDGQLEPMLADGFSQTDSSIQIHLNPKATWNNGHAVSVDDVLYTFHIDSILPTSRQVYWQYIDRIAKEGDSIVFHFDKENRNPLVILNAIANTSILPKSVFEPIINSAKNGASYDFNKIIEFKNDLNPVASGPYCLKIISPDKIVLERNDNYWGNNALHNGKLPAPKYIVHSLYNGNNQFNSAMTKGNLDVSSIFLPRIWDKAKDSIRAWSRNEPYHQPGSITTLIVSHKEAPLNDVSFRHAIAQAIDLDKIKRTAISNYTPQMQAGFILPFGFESKYFFKEDVSKFEYKQDSVKAKEILAQAGYKWNEQGLLLDKKGKPIRPITIECPSGWTDWEDAIKVIVESLNSLGIQAEEKFVDYGVWDKNLRLGTFDLAVKTQTAELSAATPWIRFSQVMGKDGFKPFGEEAFSNQGRFSNSQVDELLEKIPNIRDEESLKKAYRELNMIFMETLPVIPIMYRPTQYYQFSTKHWTNFPTEENPYAPPQHLIVTAGVKALWQITPVE